MGASPLRKAEVIIIWLTKAREVLNSLLVDKSSTSVYCDFINVACGVVKSENVDPSPF